MEERENVHVVSFAAFESVRCMYERFIKRLLIALLVTVILLFTSNIAWLHFFSQFDFSGDYVEDTYTQEGEGRFNINTGEQGAIDYGQTDSQES